MDKISWERCPECKRITVCEPNLKKLRSLCGVGVAASAVGGIFALAVLGGIIGGTIAASSTIGAVTVGSLFAILQSLGAAGLSSLMFGGIGTALGLLATLAVKLDWCHDKRTNLRIMKMDNICTGGGKSLYQLRISHIRNLTSHITQEFDQGDIKWKIGAYVSSTDSDYVGIDLVGNIPCEIRLVARLSSNDRTKRVQRVVGPQTAFDTKGLRLENIIRMETLLDPDNGFVEDESFIVDVEITDGKFLPTSFRPEYLKQFNESRTDLTRIFKFGRNQSSLRIKNTMKSCKDGCITTLQMNVTNVGNLTSHRWENFKQRDISWKIGVFNCNQYFGIVFIPDKSLKTRIIVRLKSWVKDCEPIERKIIGTSYAAGELMSIKDLFPLDKLSFYENESSLTFDVEMFDGIYLDDPHDEYFGINNSA